ncbi:hypothetical protein AX14_007965 [Amanita brunnescens Koide BX004]|nr:hypothetical protein AX14_007965 [Amanita brunnescens Koide BX004]
MAVVLPLGSRDVFFREDRHLLHGYWRLWPGSRARRFHLQDFIHFNSEGEFDLVYSRVDLRDASKMVYGEYTFPFHSGIYMRVSEDIFNSEKLDVGHPAFNQPPSEQSFSERLDITFSWRGEIRMTLGVNNLNNYIVWQHGEFKYEAVAEPIVMRREKRPSVFGLLHE